MEVTYKDEEEQEPDQSFSTADWRMTSSDCVIFLISIQSSRVPWLQVDAEKAIRGKKALVIPVYLEEGVEQELPLLLRWTRPMRAYRDEPGSTWKVVAEVDEQLTSNRRPWWRGLSPKRLVIRHFRRYLTLSPLTFCWQITVENLIVSLSVTGLVIFLWQPELRTNLENISVL